jgi:bifunctional ADP-heptose synthase (sugar kinase/adenylyltransferase)
MTKRILVIGDACQDVYTYCNIKQLAPDKPVPVLVPINEIRSLGMAGNVFENLRILNSNTDILCNKDWEKVTKNRFVDLETNHMFVRLDSDYQVPRINLNEINYDYDCIVISDYNRGFLSEDDISQICSNHPLTFLDTKKILGEWASTATYLKINEHEYLRSKDKISDAMWDKIIETRGSKGSLFRGQNYETEPQEVIDVSGAGDAFLAALVHRYLETQSIPSAIIFANSKASEVVRKRGVTKLES